MHGAGWACLQRSDRAAAECVEYCESPANCVPPDAKPAWNEDNFRCVAHYCVYRGCRSDTECSMSLVGSVCADP